MRGVMIQGTSSDVGKSLIATALCRILVNEGMKVVPFKSQNMSNNSYVTLDGKEIGRAQGIQAEAARIEANVWMNPILLKPRSDQHSEVVLLGRAVDSLSGSMYREQFYEKGLAVIKEALNKLSNEYDVIIMEGAGSPVEINLKDRELVNMKVAELADVPVILVADIERGGVFASIIGTLQLLEEEERKRVKGIIINKFRGDITLFENGIEWLEEKTGLPILGVLPYINDHGIDSEDSLAIAEYQKRARKGKLDIVVVKLPYVSNISDIEPFFHEEDVSIRFVNKGSEFGNPSAVIIPGTKSTIQDLQFLKKSGLSEEIIRFAREGGIVLGICGGYQMLGEYLVDTEGTDTGDPSTRETGLGVIPATTYFRREKQTIRVEGTYHPSTKLGNERIIGYEIHLGDTVYSSHPQQPLFSFQNNRGEGYFGEDGRIIGTYLHHLFHNDHWRNSWLNQVRRREQLPERPIVHIEMLKDKRFDQLAEDMKKHLRWEKVKEVIYQWGLTNEDT
jgi:adenosylcobyric acid synthase